MLEEDLRAGEAWRVLRFRLKFSRPQMAEYCDVDVATYKLWESGAQDGLAIKLNGLKQGEHYLVLRFRAKITQTEIARRMGMRPNQIGRGERNLSPDTLKLLHEFWDT